MRFYEPRTAYFSSAGKFFAGSVLTHGFYVVIIVGFALESGDFCPAEAVQVVCAVDDGPKTDWLSGCFFKQLINWCKLGLI